MLFVLALTAACGGVDNGMTTSTMAIAQFR